MLGHPRSSAARLQRLALAAVMLLGAGTLLQARADPARFLTFIEVRSDASQRAQAILRTYAHALRRGATSHAEMSLGATPAGTVSAGTVSGGTVSDGVVTLEEIDRPERFVLLESDEHADALAALERQARPLLQMLGGSLTAPTDRRAYRDLTPACGRESAAPGSGAAKASRASPDAQPRPLYVVAHLDIAGPMRPGPADTLARLAGAACRSAGHLRFEIWQQLNRGNHFNLIEVWKRRADFDAFAAGAAAREFRRSVGPWLGSPYDERLYRALDAE